MAGTLVRPAPGEHSGWPGGTAGNTPGAPLHRFAPAQWLPQTGAGCVVRRNGAPGKLQRVTTLNMRQASPASALAPGELSSYCHNSPRIGHVCIRCYVLLDGLLSFPAECFLFFFKEICRDTTVAACSLTGCHSRRRPSFGPAAVRRRVVARATVAEATPSPREHQALRRSALRTSGAGVCPYRCFSGAVSATRCVAPVQYCVG